MLNFLKLFFCICISCVCLSTHGFFKIVEVLPNTLDDKNLEYVSIKNISTAQQSLSGYILSDKSKEYIFPENTDIQAGEIMQFFRPQTKIILNNSNESVFLHDPDRFLIDEISYETTTKGDFLSFGDIDFLLEDDVFSQEVYISGEIFFSDEVEILEEEEMLILEKIADMLSVPDILIDLQRPSYIEKAGTGNIYVCEAGRDECRVNFNLEESFGEEFPSRDYECDIDFGIGEPTGQEGRCNPNTVTFPEGEHEVIFKIYHEDDENIFSEKIILIQNIITDDIVADGEDFENTEAISAGVITIDEDIEEETIIIDLENTITVPDVIFELQRPSYIQKSGTGNIYVCENGRDECRVNFSLEESFGEEFPSRDYECDIDFGIGEPTGQEGRCNPNTVTFPEGEHEVIFKIYYEDDESIFSEETIFIQNILSDDVITLGESEGNVETRGLGSNATSLSNIHIDSPIFEIQSGLTRIGSRYYCDRVDCKINLDYVENDDREKCFWEFGKGEAASKTTHERCNPGYVSFAPGIHKISLKVYQDDNIYNSQTRVFTIYNLEEESLEEEILEEKGEYVNENIFLGDQEKISTQIALQGQLGKEKRLVDNTLYCDGVEKCYVNFIGELSESSDDMEYAWMLDGEHFSDRLNPLGIWLGEGQHEIEFRSLHGQGNMLQEYFYVEVLANTLAKPELEFIDEKPGEPELFQQEVPQTVNIKGFTQNFLILKYDGLRISGIAHDAQKVELYLGNNKVGESIVSESGKYRIVSQNFQSGEYEFDTKLITTSGKEIYIQKSGSTYLDDTDMILWKGSSSAKRQKSYSSQSNPISGKLIIQDTDIWKDDESTQEISLYQKIFLSFILLLSLIFGGLHILTHSLNSFSPSVLHIYKVSFSIRQRISIIL